jgi:hypothetical protein
MVGFLWTESLTFVEDVGGVVLRLLELGQPVWNQACIFYCSFLTVCLFNLIVILEILPGVY